MLGLELEIVRQAREYLSKRTVSRLIENLADDFVEFRCNKPRVFVDAILAAQSKPGNKGLAIRDFSNNVCTDYTFAETVNLGRGTTSRLSVIKAAIQDVAWIWTDRKDLRWLQ
jgi:hypothetical protein